MYLHSFKKISFGLHMYIRIHECKIMVLLETKVSGKGADKESRD